MTPSEQRQLRDICVGLAQQLSNAVAGAALVEQKATPQLRQIPASWRLRLDPKRVRRAA